jgi:hypothetical protein
MSLFSIFPAKWRFRYKKGRKKPVREFTCNCEAYSFPHRFGGGLCDGRSFVEKCWKDGACGDCRSIDHDSQSFIPYFQIIEGRECLEECEMLQEFMQRNEVHIKGVKWK